MRGLLSSIRCLGRRSSREHDCWSRELQFQKFSSELPLFKSPGEHRENVPRRGKGFTDDCCWSDMYSGRHYIWCFWPYSPSCSAIKHQKQGGQSISFPIRVSSPVARRVCWERRGRGSNSQQYICWNSVIIPDPTKMNPEELGHEGKTDTFCHFPFFAGARQSLYWPTVTISRSVAQSQAIAQHLLVSWFQPTYLAINCW